MNTKIQINEINIEPTLKEHQDALYKMLVALDEVCRKHDISYILFAGTMLGAVRHNGFIPWDDDLDIMMLREDYDRFLEIAPLELDSKLFFVQKEFSEHWPMFFSKLRMNNTSCIEKYHPKDNECHQGIYIDIFPCDNASNNLFFRKIQFYCSKIVIAKSLYKRGYDTDSNKKKIFMQFCRILPTKSFANIVKNSKNNNSTHVHSFFGAASNYYKNIYKRSFFENRINYIFENKEFPISKNYDEFLTILYGDYMKIPKEEDRKCKKHAILVDLNNSWKKYDHYRDDMVFDEFTRSIR